MHLRHLSVSDYRSYTTADLPLGPGVTTLIGLNGQGKTNLVEAMGYLATLGSHRVATDAPLVRFGAPRAVVRGLVVRGERELMVELEITPGRANRARLNRSPVARPRDVLGSLRTVLFAPEDLALVKGDPSERRRFLDDLLVARQPRWAGVRADYERILRQRGALLKSAAPVLRRRAGGVRRRPGMESTSRPGDGPQATTGPTTSVDNTAGAASPASPVVDTAVGTPVDLPTTSAALGSEAAGSPEDPVSTALHTLDIWNAQLAQVGASLLYARLRLLQDLAPYLDSAYDAVSDSSSGAHAGYRSSLREQTAERIAAGEVPEVPELHAELMASLDEVRGQEIDRGISLVGPHRDDVLLTLGELPAKGYASHGESWSFALGLRLAAYQLLRHDLGEDPVLILDDVFAELDSGRRERLAALVRDCEQVIITAAVPADVPAELTESGQTFLVTMGEVSRVD